MIDIPIIDISSFLDHTRTDDVAAAVDAVCRDTGFFIVTGHGIAEQVIDETRANALSFFRRPTEDKLQYADYPYSPYMAERLSYSRGEASPPDLKEAFGFGQPDSSRDPYVGNPDAESFSHDNVYPKNPPGFAEVATRYYAALEKLSATLQRIFSIALGLPANYFVPFSDRHFSSLRYVYYPPPAHQILEGQLRAGAHTDYGDFTLVNTEESAGGLQVLAKDGTWCDVPVVPHGFVVNIGDLMEVWTNNRWVSTMHRVVVPEEERLGESERLSLVYFHEPNWDTLVTALPTCVDERHPVAYGPLSAGEHLRMKVTRQRTLDTVV